MSDKLHKRLDRLESKFEAPQEQSKQYLRCAIVYADGGVTLFFYRNQREQCFYFSSYRQYQRYVDEHWADDPIREYEGSLQEHAPPLEKQCLVTGWDSDGTLHRKNFPAWKA